MKIRLLVDVDKKKAGEVVEALKDASMPFTWAQCGDSTPTILKESQYEAMPEEAPKEKIVYTKDEYGIRRDRFAAAALQGLLASWPESRNLPDESDAAEKAVRLSDAMITRLDRVAELPAAVTL